MRISELNIKYVGRYIRLDEDEVEDKDNQTTLSSCLEAAKQYIKHETGLTDEKMDENEDLTIACLVLCQDFYDTRALNIPANKAAKNKTIENIIEMHRENFL